RFHPIRLGMHGSTLAVHADRLGSKLESRAHACRRRYSDRMRITVLTDLEKKKDPRSYDKVVDQVVAALAAGGHEAVILGVHRDLQALIDGLTNPKPELVFN